MNKVELLRRWESNARTYATTFETLFERGRGIRIWDQSGKELIDCLSCAGALPLGHNHPEVREALLDFVSSDHLQQMLDLATPAKFELIQKLYELLPHEFSDRAKIQFCSPSGSDAVEAAMKLARFATQRQSIIAFHGAYHGMTSGALAAMGNVKPKSAIGLATGHIHFAPYPYSYRCPFGTDGTKTDHLSIQYLNRLLTDPESGIPKPAAVIVEVVQGEGGCIPASVEWLRELRQLTREQDILFIVDEVQTGFARTGKMFAFEHAGILPDILVLSKALGGGYPLAVVVYNESLDRWQSGMHAGTFRGNQIAMVAGKVTMKILQRDQLDRHAMQMGSLLMEGLKQLARVHPEMGDVRGRGLIIGVEMVADLHGSHFDVQSGALAKVVQRKAFENGLLIETGGRYGAVLRFLPALTISKNDVDEILDKLSISILQAKRERG
jgi:diaminobutyrate-2-oxoglutarate transaminase